MEFEVDDASSDCPTSRMSFCACEGRTVYKIALVAKQMATAGIQDVALLCRGDSEVLVCVVVEVVVGAQPYTRRCRVLYWSLRRLAEGNDLGRD